MIVFFGVSSVGDPLAEIKLRPRFSQTTVDLITERKHLDEPLIVQYGYWLGDAFTNRFGTTLLSDRPIWPELSRALKNTVQLVIAAEVFAIILALLLGVLSARKQYSVFDYATTTISFFGYSVPIFWFALILQVIVTNIFLATGVRVFFTAGLSSPAPANFFIDRLQHLALPIIALSYVSIAQYSRYARGSMLEVLNSDYVRTARAKGLPERSVTMKHALRNALIPVVTVAAVNMGAVFSGVILTESVFSLDGMGLFFVEALARREVYALMAWLMVTSVFIIVFNLIADIVYGILDPRIRYD